MSREQNIQRLALPAHFVWPEYLDGSVANVPATVAGLLNTPFSGLAPLRYPLWQPLAGRVRRVVLLILDALGWNLIEQERERLQPLLKSTAVSAPITSVFPSTTVNALSCLWTGAAPAQHGLLGLNLYLPEYSTVGFMLDFRPSFGNYHNALVKAGLQPQTFLQAPGLAQQLAAGGVTTHAFKGSTLINSVLSQMHDRGVAGNHAVYSPADMFVQIRQLLEARPSQRLFVSAYWPTIDSLSHRRGWNHASVVAELHAIIDQLQTELLKPLSRAARKDTVFLLVADHGQTMTPMASRIYLESYPDLADMLLMFAPGEARARYFYARQGRQTAVVDYINHHLAQKFIALPAADALAAGLFGPQPHASIAADRIGDVLVVPFAEQLFLRQSEKQWADEFQATHGGLLADEMLVPWLGWRLD